MTKYIQLPEPEKENEQGPLPAAFWFGILSWAVLLGLSYIVYLVITGRA